jgi:hypothetical protein
VPKKNNEAILQILKQFSKWYGKQGVRSEFYQLSNSNPIEGLDGITKIFSIAPDEDVWMELSFSKNSQQWENACAMMVQDEKNVPMIKEFERLANYLFTAGFKFKG